MTARRAALGAGLAMFVVYAATLAPGVTFWDSGEFIAAAHSFGIPHPPGTPVFVIALKTWATLLGFLSFARATNLFSAVCTASAVAVTVIWLSRGKAELPLSASVAAGISAGAMSSVWQNATETEVYAASLALALATIAAADLAGRSNERRWLVVVVYLIALAVPLHMSALVAAPVAVFLAGRREKAPFAWGRAAIVLGAMVVAAGVGRVSLPIVAVGVLFAAAGVARDATSNAHRTRTAIALAGVALIAFSALLILPARAAHDPLINQGNPRTLEQLAYLVARRQYAVQGMWPRQAPFRLQLANWFEYADWQFALSLGPTVIPTVSRVLATIAFASLGVVGARWHYVENRRSWKAVALLFLCGSLGVIVYLNLKAGRSFAWSFVPEDARHEARDRDYFFVLGFWAWGMWAGMGAVRLARRLALPSWLGVVVAALPIALNWSAVDRRGEPEAGLARELAHELLEPLPPRSVLFVSGDNDTYPLWYAQAVEGLRRDVTVVTLPLLGAEWYTAELRRRWGLISTGGGLPERIAPQIATSAEVQGRPVAAALTVSPDERNRLSNSWTVIGLAAIARSNESALLNQDSTVIHVDSSSVAVQAQRIASWSQDRGPRPQTDPVHEFYWRVMSCPRLILASRTAVVAASLDSLCNLR
ncbi:MAG TPA: DUF2723 domain-containing protein [Gemmatimonadaceae bacterium]|nr:DUF2723 domain-containing protein [Gemmatimonadaceae bacterium]